MFSSRFLWQVWAAVSGLVLVSTLTFGLLTSNQLQAFVVSNIGISLGNQADLINILVHPGDSDEVDIDESALEEFGRSQGIRITLIEENGRVKFDNLESAQLMDNHGDRPEILEAKQKGKGISQRYSQTLGKPMLYLAIANGNEGIHRGYVRVSVSLSEVDEQLSLLRWGTFIVGLVIAIIFLFVGYLLAARFSRPIVDMTNMSIKVARGEYGRRLHLKRSDELGQLANALNQLAEGAQNRIEALTQSRNQLAAILSGLVEGVIAVDTQQRILHINQSALDLLDLGLIEYSNKPYLWEEIRHSEISGAVNQSLAEKKEVHVQIKYQQRIMDLSVVLLINNESVSGVIIVINDVTDVSRLQKIRTDFVANASHELKTPLSSIKGYIETIEDDTSMTTEVREKFIGRIRNQAERLDTIVQDLLQLSRIDGNTTDVQMVDIDISLFINEITEARISEAEESGIDFFVSTDEQSLLISGERIALWQMITNLIDNAFKYTEKGGRVEVRLQREESHVLLEVVDNGIGIEKEDQQRVFERFYRVDKARSRELGGTGLGLSIVKHVVQLHRGSIEIDSNPGQGSKFSVRIPLI